MRSAVNYVLALLVTVLYGIAAAGIIHGAVATEGFKPDGYLAELFQLTAGGIVAYLAATLGLSVANPETGVRDSVRLTISGSKETIGGEWLIGIVFAVYLTVGLIFVVLSIFTGLLADGVDGLPVTNAPDYLTTQASALVGVGLAGLAAAGAGLKS